MNRPHSEGPGSDRAPFDVHATAIASGLESMSAVIADLDAEDPVRDLDARISEATTRMSALMAGFHPFVAIEQARLFALPWHRGQPTYHAGIDDGFSCVEIVAIVAMTMLESSDPSATAPASIAEQLVGLAGDVRQLGSLRALYAMRTEDPLGWIGATLQISEISMRGSSYAELLEDTSRSLFQDPSIDRHLRKAVAFGVSDALTVLSTLHDLQVHNMNRRQGVAAVTHNRVERDKALGLASEQEVAIANRLLNLAFQPNEVAASVSVADISRATKLSEEVVGAVLDAFSWCPDPSENTVEVILRFLQGDSPLRAAPVLRSDTGRALIMHPALTQGAIRERLETILRSTPGWEEYQAHRGRTLEQRTREAFERLLPTEKAWHGFFYYVPANDEERATGPSNYTKRVEGDHLLIVGDVAVVIEDKAVALSSQARTASPFRLRRDLTGIITKAAEQAQRLVARVINDGGLRVHGEGWVDMSFVREIHTVAVSLEDLTSTSTATAELVKAGILPATDVPWTVSIHDLDLIALLAQNPGVFLLYLRRRRHPDATVFYTAPDELDLYLYFLEAGLYVPEDPFRLRKTFSFIPPLEDSEVSQWEAQRAGIITSRTDVLDAWYLEDYVRRRRGKARLPSAPPRPQLAPTPLDPLIRAVAESGITTAPAIVATLLSGDVRTQRHMARHASDVHLASNGGHTERTITVPVPTPDDGGWLFVWGTRPTGRDQQQWESNRRSYLRAKGSQLGVSRAVMFAFDGATGEVVGIFYEQVPDQLSEEDRAVADRLQPVSAMRSVESVHKQMKGQRAQPRRKGRARKR